MSMLSTTRRPTAIPFGLIGMLVLVVAIERGLSHSTTLTNSLAHMWASKAEVAPEVGKRCDVLAYGDSLVEFGVLPHVISERRGRPAYNLALPGGSPSSSYYLLKRSLESGARPSAIVVDFMPYQLLPIDVLEAARRPLWPYLAEAGEIVDLAVRRGDVELATSVGIARVLTSMRARVEIRAAILSDLNATGTSQDQINLELTRSNLRANRGAFVVPDVGRGPDPEPQDDHLLSEGRDPRIVPYVDRFLSLAASRGIPVYCLIPPVSPEYQALWNGSRACHLYEDFLRSKTDEFPNLIVLDGRQSGYPTSAFLDRQHLSRTGAGLFSDDLAAMIAEPAGPPRWRTMPQYRPRPIAARVEDVNQTRTAMMSAEDAARRR